MPGIPRDKAVQDLNLPEQLICGTCSRILVDPVGNTCQHVFCFSCVRKKLLSNDSARKCPKCNAQWDTTTSPVPTQLHQQLAAIEYYCPLRCGAHLTNSEKDQHVNNTCPNQPVPCLNQSKGCRTKVLRKALSSHTEKCHYRTVECEACGFNCLFVNLFSHQIRKRCMQLHLQKEYVHSVRQCHKNLLQYSRQMRQDRIALQQKRVSLEVEYKRLRPLGYRRVYSTYSKPDTAPVWIYEEYFSRPSTARPPPRQTSSTGSGPPAAADFPRWCGRCDESFKSSRNHDKACKYHREPFLNLFTDTCGACGEEKEATNACLRGFHIPIHPATDRPATGRVNSGRGSTDPEVGFRQLSMRSQTSRPQSKTPTSQLRN